MENIKDIKQLEDLMNSFFVSKKQMYNLIGDNLCLFWRLSELIIKSLEKIENLKDSLNIEITLSKMTPLENIEIVKEYYKLHSINFDIDRLVDDGTIDFVYNDNALNLMGRCYVRNNKSLIDTYNNGVLLDSVILVHELSHFRNHSRNVTRDLLTEALAFGEELQFVDFLKDKGYLEDVYYYKRNIYKIFYDIAVVVLPVYKMLLLYSEFSSLDKESYKMCFENDINYLNELKAIEQFAQKQLTSFLDYSWYILAVTLGSYIYFKYKDKKYYEVINNLHYLINNGNVLDFLNAIGLSDFGDNDREEIANSLSHIVNEINIVDIKTLKKS